MAPVRIFVGTEEGQWRAERVFVFAIERVRDPARVYEIHLLRDLPGFRTRGWRTGFTNYRFAVPALAAARGRAIYNDVDQIYLADPALLFDLDLGDHGYLAVSPEETSVMLLDCARMAAVWSVGAAQRSGKGTLVRAAASAPGLWGPLDPAWNARDLEYAPGTSRLLHFTALHTQPWQPFPERHSYQPHPLAGLWLDLERAADAEGYRLFSRARPSTGFAHALARAGARAATTPAAGPALGRLAPALDVRRVLHCHAGPAARLTGPELGAEPGAAARVAATPEDAAAGGEPGRPDGEFDIAAFDLAAGTAWPAQAADAVVASALLERVPLVDLLWVLDELFARARRLVYVSAVTPGARGLPALAARWRQAMLSAAARHPDVAWRLDVRRRLPPGIVRSFESRPDACAPPPRVWVLLGARQGDNAQLLALAGALGWPVDVKRLAFNERYRYSNLRLGASVRSLDPARSDPLAPPWPDLVIAAGRRSTPVARWIRWQSGDRARLVHVGRPWAPLGYFDLVITTPQYVLPARPNVLHNTLPILRTDPAGVARARKRWARRLGSLPRPLVALLVGGDSPPYRLEPDTAERLGREALETVGALGGSLVLTCGPRVRPEAAEALAAAAAGAALVHRWRPDDPDNPYLAFLALADRFIVTGDSASMLAEAWVTGKPVTVFPLPERAGWRWRATRRAQRWVEGRQARPTARGTEQQQDWIGRLWDRLVALGVLKRTRDLARVHRALEARGPATAADAAESLARAVERVRQVARERFT